MPRDEVLREFGTAECPVAECKLSQCLRERAMADEIVRLRERLAAVEQASLIAHRGELDARQERDDYKHRAEQAERERDALREELIHQTYTLSADHQRAEQVLAALREPSEAVMKAMADATPVSVKHAWLMDALRAAVAAAEREVGNA